MSEQVRKLALTAALAGLPNRRPAQPRLRQCRPGPDAQGGRRGLAGPTARPRPLGPQRRRNRHVPARCNQRTGLEFVDWMRLATLHRGSRDRLGWSGACITRRCGTGSNRPRLLWASGTTSRPRVARLMRAAGLAGRSPRRRRTTTIPDPNVGMRPDLVDRDFTTDAAAMDTRWCGETSGRRQFGRWQAPSVGQMCRPRVDTHLSTRIVVPCCQYGGRGSLTRNARRGICRWGCPCHLLGRASRL